MDKAKLAKLEAAGWTQVTVQQFLGLSDAEASFIEVRTRVSEAIKEKRTALGLTQAAVAQRLKSSQSRVAKMESADSSVTLDLMIQSLLKLGTSLETLAATISPQMEGTTTEVVHIAAGPQAAIPSLSYTYKKSDKYTASQKTSRFRSPTANVMPA